MISPCRKRTWSSIRFICSCVRATLPPRKHVVHVAVAPNSAPIIHVSADPYASVEVNVQSVICDARGKTNVSKAFVELLSPQLLRIRHWGSLGEPSTPAQHCPFSTQAAVLHSGGGRRNNGSCTAGRRSLPRVLRAELTSIVWQAFLSRCQGALAHQTRKGSLYRRNWKRSCCSVPRSKHKSLVESGSVANQPSSSR